MWTFKSITKACCYLLQISSEKTNFAEDKDKSIGKERLL